MADPLDNVTLITGDCRAVLAGMEPGSVDLVFGSPPYEDCRTYGIEFALTGQEWVDWMVTVVQASLRVCRGLVAFVVEGRTRGFRWSATPALLMADLHRAGVHLRKPPAFERVGIPGSGGPDWWRNDYEFIVCCTNGGKLPWSDNTAMGHPPKCKPGGAPSHRRTDGSRVGDANREAFGFGGRRVRTRSKTGAFHMKDGECERDGKPIKTHTLRFPASKRSPDKAYKTKEEVQVYHPPAIANPGNVINCGAAGGDNMGSKLAHENEAPFPEYLAEFFVRSFCPPDGVVLDPFLGSGTTVAVARKWGRKGIGIDIRQSQIDLAEKRIGQALRPATYQDMTEPGLGEAPLFEEMKP